MIWDRDRGLAGDTLVGGCFVRLKSDVQRLKNSLRLMQTSRWFELTRDEGRKGAFGLHVNAGWIRLRVQVALEFDSRALLASFGHPLDVLPFRVNVGDIFLFDCNRYVKIGVGIFFFSFNGFGASKTAKLISTVTSSKWDHVGVVVPVGRQAKLHLMETTSGKFHYCFAR